MKIALAQIDVKAGDPEQNYVSIAKFVVNAKKQGADIVAFPEMCVGGYLVGDLWLDDEWCRHLMSFNDKIRNLSKVHQIGIIYGNIYMMENVVPAKEDAEKDADAQAKKADKAQAKADKDAQAKADKAEKKAAEEKAAKDKAAADKAAELKKAEEKAADIRKKEAADLATKKGVPSRKG